MIPLKDLTADVIKANMLITTPHEVFLIVVGAAILAYCLGILVGIMIERKYEIFVLQKGLTNQFVAWNEERKKWR